MHIFSSSDLPGPRCDIAGAKRRHVLYTLLVPESSLIDLSLASLLSDNHRVPLIPGTDGKIELE
jgi:hypothetical protein